MSQPRKLGILFLVLVCVCFFSLPVMSGEHPWDADDDGSTKNDSTAIIGGGSDGPEVILRSSTPTDPEVGGLPTLAARLTIWAYSMYYFDFKEVRGIKEHTEVVVRSGKSRYSVKNRH